MEQNKVPRLHKGITITGQVVIEDRIGDPHSDKFMSTTYCSVSHPSGLKSAGELADRIVTAVNSTYGAGIHPEAIAEMFRSLKVMTDLTRLKYGNLDKDVWAEIERAQAAIEKATIK